MNAEQPIREACQRSFERMNEAISNIGYRLPASAEPLRAVAAFLLEANENPDIEIQELMHLGLAAARLRKQLEAFDIGEGEGK